MATTPLLTAPARRAARQIALRLLARAARASERLAANSDADALHDFRVAVRRLRSCLRAHEEPLRGSVPKKTRRRLRAVARATGSNRDAEAHLEWLGRQRAAHDPQPRAGAEWLVRRIEREKSATDAELRRRTPRDFARVRRKLSRTLASYVTTVRVDATDDDPWYAAAVADLVDEYATKLGRRLAAVSSVADHDEVHRARIAGKRLRYLLEPLRAELDGVQPVLARLKALQNILGELHDAHVLRGEITRAIESADAQGRPSTGPVDGPYDAPSEGDELRAARNAVVLQDEARPGLLALLQVLGEDETRRFDELTRDWLGSETTTFFDSVRAVAEAARALGGHSTNAVEIERKFLLNGLPDRAHEVASWDVGQGYLPGERLVERVRRVCDGGAERYYRTVKLGAGVTRTEVEEETSRELFDALWPLTQGRRLTKRRYAVTEGPFVWELDQFTDRDLVLAEVELPSEDTSVEIPDWLRAHLVREVTGEDEYTNARLAR